MYKRQFHDTATIYDWLFANYSIKPSIDTGSPVTEVKVNYSSEADTLMLYPAGDLKTVLPNDSDELLEKTFDVPESVDAPIAKLCIRDRNAPPPISGPCTQHW